MVAVLSFPFLFRSSLPRGMSRSLALLWGRIRRRRIHSIRHRRRRLRFAKNARNGTHDFTD